MVQIRNVGDKAHKSLALSLRKLYLVVKSDRTLKIMIGVIIVAGLLIGLSGQFIQPIKTTQTYSEQMYKPSNVLQPSNQKLNLYALAPDYPIYITIDDSQNTLLDYQVYFVNDTNMAIGLGPATLLAQGQISGTTNLVIPHTIYHMTYRLVLEPVDSPSFMNTVTYTQTTFQYPQSNYYLLASGITLTIAGIVMVGVKIILISSDREKYLSQLKFKDIEDSLVLFNDHNIRRTTEFQLPWFANVLLGILFCALGFTLFGRQFILTWIGLVLIIAGIIFILNGFARLLTKRV